MELPEVTASASATTICAGESVTLSGSGALTYVWDQGAENGVAFTPAQTTTYTVIGTDSGGCNASAEITITVQSASVEASASSESICLGESVTLSGSGALHTAGVMRSLTEFPFHPPKQKTIP